MSVTEWATVGSLVFNVLMILLGLKVRAEMAEARNNIQEKIREVELYTRDNFVRSTLFDQIIKLLSDNMETRFNLLQSTLDRLNDKMDVFRQTDG